MFKQEFRCASIAQSSWFEFTSHRWNESEKAHSLRHRMSTSVYDEYIKNKSYIFKSNSTLYMCDFCDINRIQLLTNH